VSLYSLFNLRDVKGVIEVLGEMKGCVNSSSFLKRFAKNERLRESRYDFSVSVRRIGKKGKVA
jgi:hypothetical protein